MNDPQVIVSAVRLEIETAVDAILTAAMDGLEQMPAISKYDVLAAEKLERNLLTILENCAFQDLTGQRLDQLRTMLGGASSTAGQSDPLLNGPALQGQGLDQTTTDGLLLES